MRAGALHASRGEELRCRRSPRGVDLAGRDRSSAGPVHKLVCDGYAGYKATFAKGIVEIGCAAQARCKFFESNAGGQSPMDAQALGTWP